MHVQIPTEGTITSSEKRLPGQANADYDDRDDPNPQFIGTQSWLDRRRGRGAR
jgi:hypothetical protein